MDRNMRSSYVSSGPRSLPHMGGAKRHAVSNGSRLSPPAQPSPNNINSHNNNNHTSQHDDLINFIYESWNKKLGVNVKNHKGSKQKQVSRDLERGNDEARYYQEVLPPRQLANFRPFNLEEWWGRRVVQTINRNKHRS